MAVTTEDRRVRLTGVGVSNWSVPLPVMTLDDVQVFDVDTTTDPDTVTEIFAGIDFTLAFDILGVYPMTFSLTLDPVVYPVGLAAGQELRVVRNTSITQDQSFAQGDTFPESVLELLLDKATLIAQDANDKISRSLRGADSDPISALLDLQLPAVDVRAQRYLSFDNNGTPTATTGLVPPTEPVHATMTGFLNYATLAAARNHLEVEKWEVGTAAARGATTPAAFGVGFWYETDTNLILYSDGATWTVYVNISNGTLAGRPAASTAGRFYYATDAFRLYYDNGATWDEVRQKSTIELRPWELWGLRHVWQSTGSTRVNSGICRDATDAVNMELAANMTKTTTVGGWQAGNNNRGAPAAIHPLTSKWVAIFVIMDGSGNVDVGFDTNSTATNLLTESGYTYYRRVGWMWMNASTQIERYLSRGDLFEFYTPILGYLTPAPTNFSAGASVLSGGPPNCRLQIHGEAFTLAASQTVLINSGDANGPVSSARSPIVAGGGITAADTNGGMFQGLLVYSDASAQLNIFSNQVNAIRVGWFISGWEDTRDRDV